MTPQLFFATDVIAVFSILVIGARVLALSPSSYNARLIAIMCFNSACMRVLARHEYQFWIPAPYRLDVGALEIVLNVARNLTPGVFMLLCHSLFVDRQRMPRWLLALFIVQVLFEDPLPLLLGMAATQDSPFQVVAALLQLLFVGCGLYWIVSGWQTDLVDDRRRLRWAFLVVVGGFVFAAVLLERLLIPWQNVLSFQVHMLLSAFGTALIVVALFALLRSDVSAFTDPYRSETIHPPAAGSSSRDDADLEELLHALRAAKIYRDGTLTIASLAAKVRLPEYRVRKLIHERLHYRNFNALLHDYRIAEACEALVDPDKKHLPILTIALTVGYNSINPFNRAFRDLKGMTPSAFRAQGARPPADR